MFSPHVEFAPIHLEGQEVERIERMTFLGSLLGFNMHARETLAPRLSKALNTFYGFYNILSALSGSPEKRLDLVNSFVTSKWRWMAAAIRPTAAILKELNVVVTTMLMGVFRFPGDVLLSAPLIGLQGDVQTCMSHRCPDAELQVMGCCALCWRHVILGTCSKNSERPAPIRIVLVVRGPQWALGHGDDVRRRQGNWPDCSNFSGMTAGKVGTLVLAGSSSGQASLEIHRCRIHQKQMWM